MFETILIFVLGLTPPLLSIWLMRRAKERSQARLRAAIQNSSTMWLRQPNQLTPDRYYLEGVGYLIGDITCRYNARSAYLRCAVNPCGVCEECPYYEPRD